MKIIEFGSEAWGKFWDGRQWSEDDRLELQQSTQDRKPPPFVLNMIKSIKQ